jgi:hypothetical protein
MKHYMESSLMFITSMFLAALGMCNKWEYTSQSLMTKAQ